MRYAKEKICGQWCCEVEIISVFFARSCKIWFSSLPRNSIDSWNKCKDAFITKYFPPAKIISLRTQIMNFKQLEHEHVAQSWERMKMMLRNCPTHGLNLWMIIQIFYAGLNFVSRNLLDSAAGGTFMEITLGEATKLLDNIMANYSQWHTKRAPTSKKKLIRLKKFLLWVKKLMLWWSWSLIEELVLILMMCLCLLWLSKIVMQ